MSRAALIVAIVIGAVGGLAIGQVIEADGVAFLLAFFWGLMTTFIVAAVDESVRN